MTKKQMLELGYCYVDAKLPTYDLRDYQGNLISSVFANRVKTMSKKDFVIHLCKTQRNIGFKQGDDNRKNTILNALGL